ncbi:hypothetical protein L3Q82_009830, partial [Scortum barcoo]
MECHLAGEGGKEPELVQWEVERWYPARDGRAHLHAQRGKVLLALKALGTQLLERGWTLHYSGVAQGVKRGAELSTNHHLVVSWIRWQRRKFGQTWQTQ